MSTSREQQLPPDVATQLSTSGDSTMQPLSARTRRRLRELWKLVRRKPAVVVLPVLLFFVVSVVGVMVVYVVSRHQENQLHDTATSMANEAASGLKLQLMSMVQPVASMTAFLSSGLGLNYTQAQQMFPKVAKKLLDQVLSPSQEMQLNLDPQGVVTDMYPLNSVTIKSIGVDLLGNPTKRNATLTLMSTPDKVYFKGPVQFAAGYMGVSAVMPVFISGVERDFNFSMPVPVSPFCPPAVCWQEATKTKFWGTVAGTWPLQNVLHGDGALTRLQAGGFRFLLRQPAINASTPATAGYGDYVMIARSGEDVLDPVEVPVDLNGDLSFQAAPWALCVSPDSGWTSAWALPVSVVIVAISFFGSLLLSAFMISRVLRVEDQDLLFTLVPKDVFKKLKERRASTCSTTPVTSAIPAGSTPAEALLDLLEGCLLGNLPGTALVVQLRATLLGLQDIYRPADVSQGLRDAHLDEDVANNLAQLLSNYNGSRAGHRERASVQPCRHLMTTSLHDDRLSDTWLEELGPMNPELPAGQCLPAAIKDCHDGQPYHQESSVSLTSMLQEMPMRTTSPMMSDGPSQSSKRPSLLILELATTQQGWATTENGALATTTSPPASRMIMSRAVQDQLQSILGHAYSSWTFDAFALDRVSDGHPLSTLGFYLVEKSGLMQHFQLPPTKVARFFRALEAAYIDNPYHSRTHASDVLQTLHVILHHGGFLHSYVDPERHLACILAAASHDVEHVGLTNDFLCTTEDELALRYNDRSPMENHHLATLFSLLKRPQHDFMKHLEKGTRDFVRKVAIEMVMATDMKQHMTMVSQFKSVHQTRQKSAEPLHRVGGPPVVSAPPVFIDETERLLSLQVAMKLADLGHLAETPEVHQKWVARLEDEFFQQGDKEREAGIPITPLFDRTKPGITKSQVGFYDFVVMPLFTSFSSVFKNVQPLVDCASDNHRFWKENAEVKMEH